MKNCELSENDVNDELNKKIAIYYLQYNSSPKSSRSSSTSPKLKNTSKSSKYKSK